MKRRLIATALCLCAGPAFAQSVPQSGTFSVNGTTITVQNGQIVGQPAARLGAIEAGCSGVHVHGTFFGAADPAPGGCGHGIIMMLPSGGSSQVPGGMSSLPGSTATGASGSGSIPTTASGQLALTRTPPDAGALFLTSFAFAVLAGPDGLKPEETTQILADMFGRRAKQAAGFGDGPPAPAPYRMSAEEQQRIATEDINITMYGTPNPIPEQLAKGPAWTPGMGLRDGPGATAVRPPAAANPPAEGAKPPPAREPYRMSAEEAQRIAREDINITMYGYPNPTEEQKRNPPEWLKQSQAGFGTPFGVPKPEGAKPPATTPPATGSILDTVPDAPTVGEAVTLSTLTPEEQELNRVSQEAADDLMSGDKARAERAQKALEFANQETKNRTVRLIVRKIQAIVNDAMRAATNAAAGAPRIRN